MDKLAVSRLGPYEIVGPLGAGGMGEVYRAKDPRLKREVAIKILSKDAVPNTERQLRFQREAQAASSLNHPNILVVYDVGTEEGKSYIVSELVEGDSLRKLMHGPMATRQILDLGVQIADALSAAHQAGIAHRDLKPENIMVTRAGRVKILDFGLAKLISADSGDRNAETVSRSLTQSGLIQGTVPYMSPEQASGKDVDARSDQFSFGLILYEMATGTRAFIRNTPVQTLSAIVTEEPMAISIFNPKLPAPLRWSIERCLAKDPGQRYVSTLDLYHELRNLRDHLSEVSVQETAAVAKPSSSLLRRAVLGLLALAILGVAFFTDLLIRSNQPSYSTYRFTPLATDADYEDDASWSPDGRTIAYTSNVDGIQQIYTRNLFSATPARLTQSLDDCFGPIWSADGTRIFYKSWNRQRNSHSLFAVGAAGGSPEVLIENSAQPATLSPDGKVLAFFKREDTGGPSFLSLWISSPPGAKPKKYAPFANNLYWAGIAHFSPDGTKIGVWIDRGSEASVSSSSEFWVLPYPNGKPYRALNILPDMLALCKFSWMPDNRHIVFGDQLPGETGSHLWFADTKGDKMIRITAGSSNEISPAVSPDGHKIAFTLDERQFDLIEVPLDGSPMRNLLATSRNEQYPAWSPVANQYAYVTDRSGRSEIWVKSVQERWERPLVTQQDFGNDPTIALVDPCFSPDGQRIAYQRYGGKAEIAVWISNLAGSSPVRLGREDRSQGKVTWSPDGNWIAYIYGTAGKFGLAKRKVGTSSPPINLLDDAVLEDPPKWSPKGDWISCLTNDGFFIVSPDGKTRRKLSEQTPFVQGWSKDGSLIYAIRVIPPPWQVKLVSIDVTSGKEKVIADLGSGNDLAAIQGFSMAPDGKSFATSIQRAKGDIWLLEGFTNKANFFTRLFRN